MNAILINGLAITYTVTAIFDYRENYAANDWDGEGHCPQCWKCKYGDDILVADGITQEMLDDAAFMETLYGMAREHDYGNDYATNWFSHFDVSLSGAPTRDEEMDLEMMEWESNMAREAAYEEVGSDGYWMTVAESMGYEA